MNKATICEKSLYWILQTRHNKHIHKYNTDLIKTYNPEIYKNLKGLEYLWTLVQCKKIDVDGFSTWFKGDGKYGYEYNYSIFKYPLDNNS